MKIGRKIYFDKFTGNVLVDTGEMSGDVVETTQEQDFQIYPILSERNADTIGVIKLDFGSFSEEFASCSGFHVDIETNEIIFDFTPEQITENEIKKSIEQRLVEQQKQIDELIIMLGDVILGGAV